MRHPHAGSRIPFGSGNRRRHRLIPILLSAVLILPLLWVARGSVSATSLTTSVRGLPSAGSTLAVVRAGGASLYDGTGKLTAELPRGTALKVTGRTPDNQWFFGSTKDGTSGWASASQLVIFGLSNLPVRDDFVPPVSSTAATPVAGPAQPAARGAAGLPAVVASGTTLNVRSGPGTSYPVIGSLRPGATVTALARNDAADWIRIGLSDLPGGSGWASARYLDLNGQAKDLPVAAQVAPAPAQSSPKASTATGLTGKLVFQERSGGKVYVYDLASGALRPLTTGADPAISPDGRTVAFWRGEGSDYALYLIDVDGGNERRILTRNESVRSPTWSPDGQKIAFSHVVGQGRCRDVGFGICMPDKFPYNQMFPLRTMDQWGLARVDLDGGSYQDLDAVANAVSPAWSDRGIFYGGSGIQVTQDSSDTSQNRVVLSEYRYQDPAMQPGGDRLVFHSLEKDHWEIFTANADGSNVVALTRPETTLVTPLPHNVAPTWSPDGQHIVFLSNRMASTSGHRTGQWKLWVMNPDGSNQRPLPADVPIEYGYQAEQAVSWGK